MPCVFCRRDVPLTAEHVFPRWTQPYFADPDGQHGTHRRVTIRADSETVETTHRGQPATLRVRSVCAECNNGWMAELEANAKPFLVTMLRGNTRAYYERGQTLIATWLVKTSLVAGSKFSPRLPSEFYTALHAEQQPSANTRVWLASTPYDGHHQSDFRPIRTHDSDEPPPSAPNAFSGMVVLGRFVGFVVSWLNSSPSIERLLARFEPALVPVWPYTAPATWPARGGALDFDALDQLADAIVAAHDVKAGRGQPNL